MAEVELKRCPVCGNRKAEIVRYELTRWRGECRECGTKTLRYYDTPAKVQTAWERCIIIRGEEEWE